MDHQFLFSLSFDKSSTAVTSSSIINAGSGTPNFSINDTGGMKITGDSPFKPTYRTDNRGCLEFSNWNNYLKSNVDLYTSKYTVGCVFKFPESTYDTFTGSSFLYLPIMSWYDGSDRYELCVLYHADGIDSCSIGVVRYPYDIVIEDVFKRPYDKWHRVIYSHKKNADILNVDGKRAESYMYNTYDVTHITRFLIGFENDTLYWNYNVLMDDPFFVNDVFDLPESEVEPSKRFIDLFPEDDIGKYKIEPYREKKKEGFAPNFYSDNISTVDHLTDAMEITRPIYYHKPLPYRTNEIEKYKFDDVPTDSYVDSAASNYNYIRSKHVYYINYPRKGYDTLTPAISGKTSISSVKFSSTAPTGIISGKVKLTT